MILKDKGVATLTLRPTLNTNQIYLGIKTIKILPYKTLVLKFNNRSLNTLKV